MILFALIALGLGCMFIAYQFRKMSFALAACGGWMLLAAYTYGESAGADWYYLAFWLSTGMVLISAIEAMGIREKKEPEETMSSLDRYEAKAQKERDKMEKMDRILKGKGRKEE